MKIWRVVLIMRNKRTGLAYAGVWIVSAKSSEGAVKKVVDSLDLGGVDLVRAMADTWDAKEICPVGPCVRVPRFDAATAGLSS